MGLDAVLIGGTGIRYTPQSIVAPQNFLLA
jgi:hypothetical protein